MIEVRKSGILRIIPLLITIFSLSFPAYAQYGGGTGEPNDPYLIYTAEQMNAIGDESNDWDKHFKLMADIDLSFLDGKENRPSFNIIGTTWENQFTGIFDGNGHTISNLTITVSRYLGYVGMFGLLGTGAEVMNLGVVEVNTTGLGNYVGGLAGYNDGGSVTGCYSTGVISGNWHIGGLVGYNSGNVTSCYSTGAVIGKGEDVGGLVGQNQSQGKILQSYSISTVSGKDNVGGLVGSNWGIVTSCYSTGTVSGEDQVGGLVGSGEPDYVKKSVWDMETSGFSFSAGGVGLTTTEMMDPEMLGLSGFFDNPNWILESCRDYPRLSWEGTGGHMIPEPVVDWLDGIGTLENPYQIEQADQLLLLHKSSILWDKNFILNADIDMDPNLPGRGVFGQAVIPVFEGSFVGNGYEISNLQIEGKDNLGFFGKLIKDSEVRDIGLKNISVYSTGSKVGGLVGNNNGGHVLNSYSIGVIIGSNQVGGLLGDSIGGHVLHSYSSGSVRGTRDIGGLAGNNGWKADIRRCYSDATVCGDKSIGGLVGGNIGNVTHCYSSSPVCGSGWGVGGLAGSGNHKDVINCFWDIQTSTQITSNGGIGKTTAEMQTASTFLNAGWDFVGEVENGTDDIWWIDEGQDYPKLKELPDGPRHRPHMAFCPDPHDGAIEVIRSAVLIWAPANPAIQHDIYLGEDKQSAANATTSSLEIYRGRQPGDVPSYEPGILEWGETYYWRIDEISKADPNSPCKGNVWSFTTADFIIVDDFESYNDLNIEEPESNRIYLTWVDGWDDPAINGSVVGPLDWFDWYMIVHNGMQSMPFNYDNAVGNSWATADIADLEIGRDWTIEGVGILSLWFRGDSANALETMYVVLNGIAGVDNDDPNATQVEEWTEWRIDLQEFAGRGVNLTNVNTITIGFGDRNNPQPGGSGKLWFDDIRLYRPVSEKPEP